MNVINLPLHRTAVRRDISTGGNDVIPDAALHELLRKAVVAYRAGAARVPGSLSHRHHLAVAQALFDAIAIVLGEPGLDRELIRCVGSGTTDIRRLALIARNFSGPESA